MQERNAGVRVSETGRFFDFTSAGAALVFRQAFLLSRFSPEFLELRCFATRSGF
jgi:hypothetical protein